MKIYDPPPSSFDASPIFTGTVTFPDGSTWTSSGVTMAAGKTAALLVTTATSLALGGAIIGTNALAVTGSVTAAGSITTTGANGITSGQNVLAGNIIGFTAATGMFSTADGSITFANNALSNRFTLTVAGATATPNFQLGAAAVDTAPVAQTLSVQNTLAGGTSNVAGANWTLQASAGKGTGVGGDWAVQIAPAGSTGTVVNAFADALRIKGAGSVLVGIASVATNAADGFLYIAGNAGTPTGTPTTRTGYIPAYVDTTNSQMWLYMGGAWKQPKTPAGAALITWQ